MLTGELPFGEEKGLSVIAIAMRHLQEAPIPLRQLRPALPWTLEALLLQTLEKRGAARPTADELSREFAMAIGLPAPTSIPAPGPRPQAVSETRASDLRPTLRFPTGDAGS